MANSRSVPDGLCVLHHCDNPPCVNPAHLFLGSVDDNNKDRSAKGRSSQGADHWTHARPAGLARDARNGHATTPEATRRGSAHPRARLTEADVVAIRGAYRAGDVNLIALARSYGVARSMIGHIVRGESWTDCEARWTLTDLGRCALAMERLFGDGWPTLAEACAAESAA